MREQPQTPGCIADDHQTTQPLWNVVRQISSPPECTRQCNILSPSETASSQHPDARHDWSAMSMKTLQASLEAVSSVLTYDCLTVRQSLTSSLLACATDWSSVRAGLPRASAVQSSQTLKAVGCMLQITTENATLTARVHWLKHTSQGMPPGRTPAQTAILPNHRSACNALTVTPSLHSRKRAYTAIENTQHHASKAKRMCNLMQSSQHA